MADKSLTVPLTLKLDYAHPLGELAPYFQGLDQGRAVASRCPKCGRTACPPRLICPDDGRIAVWSELSGRGRVVSVSLSETTLPFGTTRARHAFALIQLEGAENLIFGRLAGDPARARAGQRVRIARAPGTWPHPAQAAWFVAEE